MIVISSGEVNREGWRLLPEGGRKDKYEKNPILLFHHSRANRWDSKEGQKLPVGRIENLRLENGRWIADDPIWDENDEFAMILKGKFDGKFLNAFSPGIIPITVSDDAKYLLQGQTRSTVVDWEYVEISITDIPKDGNATRLCLSNDQDATEIIPIINQKDKEMSFEKIALRLNLPTDATEDQILKAIDGKNKDRVTMLLALGVDRKVITDDNKETYAKLAAADFESTQQLILSASVPVDTNEEKLKDVTGAPDKELQLTLGNVLKQANKGNEKLKGADSRDDWDYLTWSKKDPNGLLKMKNEEPEKYEELALAYADN